MMRKAAYGDVATRLSSRNRLAFGLTWDDDEHPVHSNDLLALLAK